jgi:quercetin dioxygenase-like cupin family protein
MTSKLWICLCSLALGAFLYGHAETSGGPSRVLANPGEVKWESSKGSESATLREDSKSGAIELFARYPAGHIFPPHWHSANERIVLIEGRISIENNGTQRFIEPGGYAYLPAREVQSMTCASQIRCSFYVFWDAPLDFHPATQ